jgi:multiple sugar transport system substrate-binding protein
VAMTPIHTWYTCCFQKVNWDVGAIPSYNGHVTAKLHADTFSILKGSKNPDLAFQVLTLMLGEFAPDLVQVYGAFPARTSLQPTVLAAMQKNFPNADLQVFVTDLSYPDRPNHESGMPNFQKASDTYTKFYSLYKSKGDLDLDKEIDKMISDLDVVFQTK